MGNSLRGNNFVITDVIINVCKECRRRGFLVCLRDKYINIYYNGHSLMLIKSQPLMRRYEIIFDFNHAKYTENNEDIKSRLEERGCFVKCGKPKANGYVKRTAVLYVGFGDDAGNIISVMDVFKRLIDDFYDETLDFDHFRHVKVTKKIPREKYDQQKIIMANRDTVDGYCFYDMEFMQIHKNKAEQQAEDDGRPDMLAVRFSGGIPQALVLVELKTRKAACYDATSGVQPHLKRMKAYVQKVKNMTDRRTEAQNAFRILHALGQFDGDIPDGFTDIPAEILFVFTGESVSYEPKPEESGPINVSSLCLTDDMSWKIRI